MRIETKMDIFAFFLWLIGLSIIIYSLGYAVGFGLVLLFISDNIMSCRKLEKMGLTDWWRYQ